jgi:O-acetyl-ADP-ribose deacetylase (regulator of RNase III)
MSINIINTNILDVTDGTIVHSVNCMGPQGGLAGAIARKWPHVREHYLDVIRVMKNSPMLLGKVSYAQADEKITIANLFGQYNISSHSRQTDYAALKYGFIDIKNNANGDIHLPYKIGCGLGGGEWDIVWELIENCFMGCEKTVYIHKLDY